MGQWSRMCRLGLCFLWLIAVARAAAGQDWAREMFDHVNHDFGTVARGAKVQHAFKLENIFEEDVHIATIRSSCGCTTPRVSQRLLKTWDTAEIVAEIDTRGFKGRKDATLTVVFDRPFPAEVRLTVHTYIRSDVVIQPGVVAFGTVTQGSPASRQVSISYAGRSDWRIDRVESSHPYLKAEIVPTSQGAGQVNYQLSVNLAADAPAGYVNDHLTLVTNDLNPRTARVPVPVEGIVVAALSVRPSPLLMGVTETEGTATGRLVVQGQSPFHITSIHSSDPRFECPLPEEAKKVHLLPVTFTAGQEPGKVSVRIDIATDAAAEPLSVDAHVRVIPRGPVAF